MSGFIPISKPSIGDRELAYVSDAVKSGWVSSLGEYIERFEAGFAEFCGSRYGIAVSNGTVALHLALVAFGVKPGDEVVVPDLTFVATGNAVKHAGATPVFVDIDPATLCMDPDDFKSVIGPKTKAAIPVHLYGHPAPMKQIVQIANDHNIVVIEDAAEAHGAEVDGKRVGSLGHAGVFSFYGNKMITTGEGGIITTDDQAIYERARYLRDHAMSKETRYWHNEIGYNYRITNIQAALGLAQLERIEEFLQTRRWIFDAYKKRLGGLTAIRLNPESDWARNALWLACLQYENWTTYEARDAAIEELKRRGVDSRPYFYPMTQLPMYSSSGRTCVNALRASKSGINLPTFHSISEAQIETVCTAIKDILALES
jgi:perosamine synthetase